MSDMVHGMDVKVCVEGIENQKELEKMLKVSPITVRDIILESLVIIRSLEVLLLMYNNV